MNQITKFAVKYPVTILMLTLAICLLGTISYNKLGTDLFPDMKNPALYIELKAGERPPEEMEKQFVKNIESVVARQDGVKAVFSSCRVGFARITVEYAWEQDMDAAFLDLQRGLSMVSQNNEISSLNVLRYDANARPVMTISLRHPEMTDMNELRKVAENYMRNELVRIEGVADIQLNGQEEAHVEIKTDPYMLEAHDLTVDDIASRIENLIRNVSGGTIINEDIQYTVKGVNLIKSVEDINNIIVTFKEPSSTENDRLSNVKAPVYLRNVAEVRQINKVPDNIARVDGERCLGISIYKENKYNTVKVVDNINAKLQELKKSMPGYEIRVISDQGQFINAAVGEVKNSAVLGIILAIIILYVFLRRINTTLIVSLAIPISIIATFNLMYFNGLTLNIMTLGGLALGAGMLVDNAIVVVENIFRNLENGMTPKEAAIKGTSEVGGAITSSTLTTIVVFLPIIYVQGAAGELFKEQAWTVTFSLLSSLFVAVLFIPMLASKFLKGGGGKTSSIQIRGYGRFVGRLLIHRNKILLSALLLTIAAYLLIPLLGMEFMPKSESNEFNIRINMEPGSRLKNTDYAALSIERMVKDLAGNDLEWIYSLAGPSHTDVEISEKTEEENQAELKVRLKKSSSIDADNLIAALINNAEVPEGVEITYEKEQSALQSALGTEGAPLIIEIKGEELYVLEHLSGEIKNKVSTITGIYDIKTSLEKGAPEVNISMDRLKSGIYGLDISSVAQQVSEKLGGKSAGSYESQGEVMGITIQLPEISLSELQDTEIRQGDKKYRLGEVADVTIETAPREINRSNQSRMARVTALLHKDYTLNQITPAIKLALEGVDFPAKYSAKITGEEEKREESFGGLSFALMLSVLLVYMVMAAQFESLRHPFTILLTIPLAGVGTILTFLIFGESLNMMAFIGIIMLAGIAVNSSIILVDRINQLKADGLSLTDAIIGASQQRVRPIIMTSLTTILALLPMCFGFGEGASLRSPMALAVIGGLVTSTILTLVVIPCIYYVLDKKGNGK
ncbi:efflux RND transporter permease subunit [Porphyromonadaceae bacterium OttesenSCG-928-L07]|nr:efflux RND transporter permease subunit [Porphyromonadaceae bacterium OttesenSCG-928-L07]MDL2252126.1 efflux RND transporter permease subunit [Odoribacter sp. OttesenSCG-928-J03]MDL2330736.1 efflux RND transporter permease subunit [Odoribacter sp. OttesenSCG-928-A06]